MIREIAKLNKKKRELSLDIIEILDLSGADLEKVEILSKTPKNYLNHLVKLISSFSEEDFEKFINCLSLLSKIVDTLNSHSRDLEIIKERIQEDNKKTQFEDSTDMMIKTLSKGVEKLNVR